VQTKKKIGELRATLVLFDRSWLTLSENPEVHHPKKRTVKPGDAFENTAF
jgi:hypothetical protein